MKTVEDIIERSRTNEGEEDSYCIWLLKCLILIDKEKNTCKMKKLINICKHQIHFVIILAFDWIDFFPFNSEQTGVLVVQFFSTP